MKARIRKRQRNRRILLITIIIVIVATVAIAIALYNSLQSPLNRWIGQPVDSSLYSRLNAVSKPPYGPSDRTLFSKVTNSTGSPNVVAGKPVIFYIGADYCPYCAFQRWPLILALLRFGNFTGLTYMASSATDVYANSATFSFTKANYTSQYVIFQGYELQDRSGVTIATAPAAYKALFQQYGSSYPFISVENSFLITQGLYLPGNMAGKNWTQVITSIQTTDALGTQIRVATNLITALICQATGNRPAIVCNSSSVTSARVGIPTQMKIQPSADLRAGIPIAIPSAWARVQYGQIAWIMKSSADIRYRANNTPNAQTGTSRIANEDFSGSR